MKKIIDNYGDPLTVETLNGGKVYITVDEDKGERRAQVEFSASGALRVAEAIQAVVFEEHPDDAPQGDANTADLVNVINGMTEELARIADALDEHNQRNTVTFKPTQPLTWTFNYDTSKVTTAEPAKQEEPRQIEPEDVEEGQVVTFTYQGEHDAFPRQRKLRVEYSDEHADGWVVIGGEDLDQDDYRYRTFREDRIKSPILVVEEA